MTDAATRRCQARLNTTPECVNSESSEMKDLAATQTLKRLQVEDDATMRNNAVSD